MAWFLIILLTGLTEVNGKSEGSCIKTDYTLNCYSNHGIRVGPVRTTLSLQYGRHQCLICKHNYNMGDWYTPDSRPVKGLLM